MPDLLGKIVVATGQYCNLNNESLLKDMDEAIPVVELCRKEKDKRVFGVIGGFDKQGEFHIGNLKFNHPKSRNRAIIQTVGEGCILVCNINGPLENGDYITTSPIDGYGMKQDDDVLKNHTVAKITCDCPFDDPKCKTVLYNGKRVKVALVGCTYHC